MRPFTDTARHALRIAEAGARGTYRTTQAIQRTIMAGEKAILLVLHHRQAEMLARHHQEITIFPIKKEPGRSLRDCVQEIEFRHREYAIILDHTVVEELVHEAIGEVADFVHFMEHPEGEARTRLQARRKAAEPRKAGG